MRKHFLVQRTEGNDWYDKAREFLSNNNCNPLVLEISTGVDPASIFQQALASLSAKGEEFKIDAEAAALLVTADLSKVEKGGSCACMCGHSDSCSGGGSGSGGMRQV